jgi:GTP-binding protein HflX
MAGGEYQVADYYEMIKRQMKEINEKLEKIREERGLRRRHRKKNFYLISLAGYTNAGKSSLLNLLSDEKVEVGERLFSTLSTTTRKIDFDMPILLTDTVGFIKDLPHWLIQAFRSTLEEIELADEIVLLVDVSEEIEKIVEKMDTSLKELARIGGRSTVIVALNKIDLIGDKELKSKIAELEKLKLRYFQEMEFVPISVKENRNIDLLLEKMRNALPKPIKIEMILPPNSQSFISWIYDNAFVSNINVPNVPNIQNDIKISIKCDPKMKEKIISKCEEFGGKIEQNEIN